MNTSSTLNIALTSAVALGFAGITYVVLRKSLKQKVSHVAPDNLNINLITSEEDSEDAVNELRRRSARYHAIGFDCEWVSDQGKKHPVALLQLSTYDGYCALFRLSHLKSIPNCLKDLLEDGNIYKVGVSPGNDVKYLAKDYSVYTKSTLDIRHLAELCNYEPGGLGSLSKALLGIELDKSWRIRCSDWEAEELTERQITYAALDAHVALKIFVKLVNDYNKTPQFSPWRRNSTEHWNNISQLCSKYLDIGYKTKNKAKNDKECKEKKSKGTKEVVSKRYTHATRSKPLYHNCLLTAPDGELLSTCDDKKAKWYVENELADTVCAEPLTVRLRFEPAGRSVGDAGRYYQLSKENRGDEGALVARRAAAVRGVPPAQQRARPARARAPRRPLRRAARAPRACAHNRGRGLQKYPLRRPRAAARLEEARAAGGASKEAGVCYTAALLATRRDHDRVAGGGGQYSSRFRERRLRVARLQGGGVLPPARGPAAAGAGVARALPGVHAAAPHARAVVRNAHRGEITSTSERREVIGG